MHSVGGMAGQQAVSAAHLAADDQFGPCLLPECPNYSGRLRGADDGAVTRVDPCPSALAERDSSAPATVEAAADALRRQPLDLSTPAMLNVADLFGRITPRRPSDEG